MKREFLKELGLTDEQIDKVMAENGKDIEKHKTTAETHKTENENLKSQLEEANKQIEDFKGMDIEGIKKAADEYKQKFEDVQAKAKADMEKIQFDHALEKALTGAKAKNAKAVKALLDLEALKFNNGELVGFNEQLEKVKKENDYLFEADEPSDSTPGITTKINKNNPDSKSKTTGLKSILENASIRK